MSKTQQMPYRTTKTDKLTKSDKLQAWVTFGATVAGILTSFFIALMTISMQEESTFSIESKMRYAQIVTELHGKIRSCKMIFRSPISRNGENSKTFLDIANDRIFSCKSELAPYISGLKLFNKKNEPGYRERMYLIKINKRINDLRFMITTHIKNEAPLSDETYKIIIDSMIEIAVSENEELATLEGLENLLIND